MEFNFQSIGFVRNSRKELIDDKWGIIISEIELDESIPSEALNHISDFSHLDIIYHFHNVKKESIVFSGYPRGNQNYPEVGIFAQRKKDRPNCIGLCTVELLKHLDRKIIVKYLDAIDGTPILDIKPVFQEFQPRTKIIQPFWVNDLMRNYWF